MNNINDIITMIPNIGFPILACVYLYKQNVLTIEKLRDSIEKNTNVISRLMERISSEEREVNNENK